MVAKRPRLAPPVVSEPADPIPAFASTKREILLIMKRQGQVDLGTLAGTLGVTKMAVLKHIRSLEDHGLIERVPVRHGPGRPRLALRLAPRAAGLFPKAYGAVTCAALAFIEERMGREAVGEALRRRQAEVLREYGRRLGTDPLGARVEKLAALRDRDGYMAEARAGPRGRFELLEYNCPILAVAETYWEACEVEQELFTKVLQANVETTHRVVAGSHVCRFVITSRQRRGSA